MPGITYTITADTKQAVAESRLFFLQAQAGMAQVSAAAKNLQQSSAGLNIGLSELKSTTGAMTNGIKAFKSAAFVAGSHLAPELVYPVMGAVQTLKALRLAALASGLSLGTLLLGTVALSGAVATGTAAWSAYKAKLQEVQSFRDLASQRSVMTTTLFDLVGENMDRLKPGEGQALRQKLWAVITGEMPESEKASINQQIRERLKEVNLSPEMRKQMDDVAHITYEQHKESLSGINAERVAENQRYNSVLARIAADEAGQKTEADSAKIQEAYTQARIANETKLAEIDRKYGEEAQKRTDDSAQKQLAADQEHIKSSMRKLETGLPSNAVGGMEDPEGAGSYTLQRQIATRYAAYENEYKQRVALVNQLYLETTMSEEQYNDFLLDAQNKRVEGQRRETAAKTAIRRMEAETAVDTKPRRCRAWRAPRSPWPRPWLFRTPPAKCSGRCYSENSPAKTLNPSPPKLRGLASPFPNSPAPPPRKWGQWPLPPEPASEFGELAQPSSSLEFMQIPTGPITAPDTQSNLKSYFQTGVEPTRYAFASLVDTQFYLFNQAIEASDAAQTAAENVEALFNTLPVAPISAEIQMWQTPKWLNLVGCTVSGPTGPSNAHYARIDFNSPFSDTKYFLHATVLAADYGTVVSTLSKANGYAMFGTGSSGTWRARIAIWPYSVWNAILENAGLFSA